MTAHIADAPCAMLAVEGVDGAAPARPRWLAIALGVWVTLYGLLIAVNIGGLSRNEFHDPDDQLRLQQVRDLLAGQNWFDLHQYRVDAEGGGVLMHWSRLIDIPVAGVMLLVRPLFGQEAAEFAALVAVPALTLLAILALVGWIAARTLPLSAVPMAILAVAFAAPVIVQVLPARIDHHGWQIALALAAMAATLDRDARRGGWISGAALAAWMAISFEGLPLSAWFIAMLAAGALIVPATRPRLVAAMQALAAVSAGLFLATRGLADLANHCDAISPIHLAAFAWGAVAITAAHLWQPQSRPALLAGLGAAGLGALAIVVSAAPQCTTGTFDMLDPVVRSFWYDNVQEGKPIFATEWHLAAQYTLPPLIGLIAAVRLARLSMGDARLWWVFFAAVLAGALVISLLVARAASVAGALAVIPLGWQLSLWLAALKRPPNPLLRLAELVAFAAVMLVVLLPVVPVMAIENLFDDQPGIAKQDGPVTIGCNARRAGGAFERLPPGGILAPLDIGPDLLISTNLSVLATGHHRGAPAMRLVIDAFSGSPEHARAIMAAKNLRYLAICPKLPELDLYRERAPEGFAAQLKDGRVPPWLKAIPTPAESGVMLWRRIE